MFVSIHEYEWTDDYSYLRKLTCKNHPTARYLTKNPWFRGVHIQKFPDGMTSDCSCPFNDMVVIIEE